MHLLRRQGLPTLPDSMNIQPWVKIPFEHQCSVHNWIQDHDQHAQTWTLNHLASWCLAFPAFGDSTRTAWLSLRIYQVYPQYASSPSHHIVLLPTSKALSRSENALWNQQSLSNFCGQRVQESWQGKWVIQHRKRRSKGWPQVLASFIDPRQAFGPDKVIPPQILANAKV